MNCRPAQNSALYEIVSVIGKGGMGEVYRARDNKLDRDVAIVEVLAGSLAVDRERLARFGGLVSEGYSPLLKIIPTSRISTESRMALS